MICPYNGFKEMDCEQCAAYQVAEYPGHNTYLETIRACMIARNGGTVTPKPMIMIPEEDDADDANRK